MKEDKNSFSFDLQKAHTLPVLNTSTAYYKHQLVLCNDGIHDMTVQIIKGILIYDERIKGVGVVEKLHQFYMGLPLNTAKIGVC